MHREVFVSVRGVWFFHVLSCLLLAILIGCGGGSGGSDDPQEGTINPSPVTPEETDSQFLNGVWQGRLFASRWGTYVDLATGQYTQIANGEGDVAIYPSADGQEYLATIRGYRLVEDDECSGFLIDLDRIEIRDIHTNLLKAGFNVYENLWGVAKLSPDGQAIAVRWENEKGCPNETQEYLTIFSRNGEIISQSRQAIEEFEWLPDNRLIYAIGKEIYTANVAYELDGVMVRSLADMTGEPSRLTASPDGTRILFELVTKQPTWLESTTYRNATVWSMNQDGTNLHLFATTRRENDANTDTDDPRVNNPVFSLDGQSVMLTEGYFSGIAFVREWYSDDLYEIISIENTGLMYAISANSTATRLPPDGSYPARVMRSLDSEGTITPLGEMIISTLSLAPKVDSPPENPGSLPSPSTQINRGIGGTLYYVDDDYSQDTTVIRSLDIATGQQSQYLKLTDDNGDDNDIDLGFSTDRNYISLYLERTDNNNILILDVNGNIVKSITVTNEDFDVRKEGAIVFSPLDDHLIALQFEYTDEARDRKKYVTIWNWQTGGVLKTFEDREYIHPVWTPDGHLLIWDREGGLYQARVEGDQVGEPQLLFRAPEPVSDPALSHDGTRLVFSMARHLWVCNLDGAELTQLTVPAHSGLEVSPVWSPDDRHIMLKSVSDGDELKDGSLWIIAADASNVRLKANSDSAMPVTDQDHDHLRYVYGTLTWR
ncbi:MAG: hypothetical protein P8163_18755 [Candidatus Thiodiazotropha sp.]